MRFSLNTGLDGKAPVSNHNILPLDMLRAGQWAEVADVTGEPCWVGRMAELGIRVGSRLRILQPGSPCLLQVGDARLSLRGDCAAQIFVCPVPHASVAHAHS